jgi:uncharacterized protein YbjT (DUF2867 family)
MAPTKLLTVFGATGNQGGSVIAQVLSNPTLSAEYKIRGVTRDPSKPNAQKLSAQGVEMVAADMNDSTSVHSAVSGSHAVFAVTNYWEQQSRAIEVQQGKTIADASKAVGVKHLIWASLPNVTNLTGGKLRHVAHFDGKADVEEYVESIKGTTGMIASYWMPGFFMSNFKDWVKKSPETGVPTLTLPFDLEQTQVGLLDAPNDTGKFVAGLLLAEPHSTDGVRVQGVSQWATPKEIVDTISKVSGTKVEFQEVTKEQYQTFLPPPIAEEMAENMVLVRDWSYYGKGAEKKQQESNKFLGDMKLTSFEEYVKSSGPWKWD